MLTCGVPSTASLAECAARRVTLRGLVSETSGRRPGGAGGFFAKLFLNLRSAKSGRRDSCPGQPVGGRTASRTPRRTGAESWVFAGKMRVSVQLAYKVPVLGSQDRHFLHAPRPPPRSPPFLGPRALRLGPHLPCQPEWNRLERCEPRDVCEVWGESLASAENGNVFNVLGSGEKGLFTSGPACLAVWRQP